MRGGLRGGGRGFVRLSVSLSLPLSVFCVSLSLPPSLCVFVLFSHSAAMTNPRATSMKGVFRVVTFSPLPPLYLCVRAYAREGTGLLQFAVFRY